MSRFPDTETGGLLLGYADFQNGISVLEATDSGYQNGIHEVGSFAYDSVYEEHLCNFLRQLYRPPLQLVVGVWHKHNAVHSQHAIPFSRADEKIHHQLLENNGPCISILFEKSNEPCEDICYKTSVFLLSPDEDHQDITPVTVWGKAPETLNLL